ncbi:MAG: hypothetical protein M0Z53_14020 [Thermaerobacter sp.]|nr:hypothetical protein [Thermaerobacter sp.]
MRYWMLIIRIVDGGYFVWRGIHKWLVPPATWLIPRVTPALPSTPLAPIIRKFVYPHLIAFGLGLGTLEVLAGSLLVIHVFRRGAAAVLAILNTVFLLTLGFVEPHDLELNLLMGILNLMFATRALDETGRRNRAALPGQGKR